VEQLGPSQVQAFCVARVARLCLDDRPAPKAWAAQLQGLPIMQEGTRVCGTPPLQVSLLREDLEVSTLLAWDHLGRHLHLI
jgi:hypothetical protein